MTVSYRIISLRVESVIGSHVLLFPDTGADFVRALKAAALYSESVTVPTVYDIAWVRGACADIARAQGHVSPKAQAYLAFVREHQRDIALLKREGILHLGVREAVWITVPDPVSDPQFEEVPSTWPSSLFHLQGCSQKLLLFTYKMYLAGLVGAAEEVGLTLLSWNPQFLGTVWAYSRMTFDARTSLYNNGVPCICPSCSAPSQAYFRNRSTLLGRRKSVASRLAYTILERDLPAADDLPMDEILRLREVRSSELQAFRVGVDALAAQIDLSRTWDDVELQIENAIATKVNPALQDLQSALFASRLDALKKIGKGAEALARSMISFMLSVAMGAPLALGAVAGVLVPIAGTLAEAEIERRKLLHANQWSILLRLKKRAGR